MVKVDANPGFEPPHNERNSGRVFYLQNGRWVVKNGTTPNNPQTAAQMKERAGLAAASRKWAYDAGSTEKASWNAASQSGTGGAQLSNGQQSCLWETEDEDASIPTAGTKPDCPTLPEPSYDPEDGSLSWDVTFPDATTGSRAWIMAGLRQRPGMKPYSTRQKVIWRGEASDATIDLTDELAAKFGTAAVGAAGVDLTMRYGSPSNGW